MTERKTLLLADAEGSVKPAAPGAECCAQSRAVPGEVRLDQSRHRPAPAPAVAAHLAQAWPCGSQGDAGALLSVTQGSVGAPGDFGLPLARREVCGSMGTVMLCMACTLRALAWLLWPPVNHRTFQWLFRNFKCCIFS